MRKYLKYGNHIQPRKIRVIAHNMARVVYQETKISLPKHLELVWRLNNCSRTKMKRKRK